MKNYGKELTPVTYSPAAITGKEYAREAGFLCFRLHWHDRVEILRMRKGTLHITFDGNEAVLHSGDAAIFSPRMIHSGIAGEDGAAYDIVMFDIRNFYNPTEICQTLLPALFDGRAKICNVTSEPKIIAAIDALTARLGESSLAVTADVYRFLHLLMKHCLLEISDAIRNDTVREIILYLEEHFKEELDGEQLCEKFGYSAAHLGRKFKDATGLTPMRYLRIYRLEEAHKLLKNTDLDIGQIAAQCGFADANYFTRCFKRQYNKAPSQVRK